MYNILKREMLLRLIFDTPLYSSCALFVFTDMCLIKFGSKMGWTFTHEMLIVTLSTSVSILYPSVPKNE